MPKHGLDKFLEHVGDMGEGCWEWQGYFGGGKSGLYGRFIYESVGTHNKRQAAHRWIYRQVVEEVPEEMVLDHLCHNHRCVNPDHLEIVTQTENNRRAKGSSCCRGHPLSGDNLYLTPNGRRQCRECRRESVKRYRLAARG